MTKKIFIAFSIETNMDQEGVLNHFDPAKITKILGVQPIQTQSYDKEQKEPPRSRKPGNPWCSSWIYRIEGNDSIGSDQDTYLESLMDYCAKQFLEPKKNSILEIMKTYDALCYLEIYIFNAEDSITSIFIAPHIMKTLLEINCPIKIYTHSNSISYYTRYQQKSMFHFPENSNFNS